MCNVRVVQLDSPAVHTHCQLGIVFGNLSSMFPPCSLGQQPSTFFRTAPLQLPPPRTAPPSAASDDAVAPAMRVYSARASALAMTPLRSMGPLQQCSTWVVTGGEVARGPRAEYLPSRIPSS
jgi:hypothetical protein